VKRSSWTEDRVTSSFSGTAEAEAYLRESRSWGRWGPSDERGAANLISPAKRAAAATLVRSGRAVSLARPFHPAGGRDTLAVSTFERGAGGGCVDELALHCHGPGATHIDALCHVWGADGMWNGRDPATEIDATGVRHGTLGAWRDGLLTRGVLLDVPSLRGVPYVTQDRPVHGHELAAAAAAQGVRVEPGDALLIHSGREEYERQVGVWSADPSVRPGLESSCLRYFHDTDCAALLWDMGDVRPNEHGLPFPVHAAVFAYGMAVVDAALLEPLARACQEEGRWDFLLTINPLDIVGATGCLVNPVAVF
jgi:kynurenine formamidase